MVSFSIYFLESFLDFLIFQCCQNFYHKNPELWAQKSRKKRAQKPKKTEKKRVSTSNFSNFDPPYFFYCIFMHEFSEKSNFFIKFLKKLVDILEKKLFSKLREG